MMPLINICTFCVYFGGAHGFAASEALLLDVLALLGGKAVRIVFEPDPVVPVTGSELLQADRMCYSTACNVLEVHEMFERVQQLYSTSPCTASRC